MTTAQDRSDDSMDLDFRILGPVVVTVNGSPVDIATRRQRALLVLLLLNVGRVVPAERLIEQLWDGSPPPQAPVTLRSYVSNLRQTLAPTGLGAALVTRGAGYMMDVPPATIDATRLRTLTERGRDLLRRGEPLKGFQALDEAVALWAGDPLAEIADHEVAQSSIVQLTETYLGAVESRFEALIALGRHADALPGPGGLRRRPPPARGTTGPADAGAVPLRTGPRGTRAPPEVPCQTSRTSWASTPPPRSTPWCSRSWRRIPH